MPRRTAKEWDNEVLRLETKLYDCGIALHQTRHELDQALAVLHDVSEEGGLRARVVDLERALWDVTNMVTGKGNGRGSWGGMNRGNPYSHQEVKDAYLLLTGNPIGTLPGEE